MDFKQFCNNILASFSSSRICSGLDDFCDRPGVLSSPHTLSRPPSIGLSPNVAAASGVQLYLKRHLTAAVDGDRHPLSPTMSAALRPQADRTGMPLRLYDPLHLDRQRNPVPRSQYRLIRMYRHSNPAKPLNAQVGAGEAQALCEPGPGAAFPQAWNRCLPAATSSTAQQDAVDGRTI